MIIRITKTKCVLHSFPYNRITHFLKLYHGIHAHELKKEIQYGYFTTK